MFRKAKRYMSCQRHTNSLLFSLFTILLIFPPVAQLDNAADSDSEERGFESLQAGQFKKETIQSRGFLLNFRIFVKGFEQAVKKQSGGLFFRRGNEQSEAIGAGAPRKNPFKRAKKNEAFTSFFFIQVAGLVYHHALACISSP